MLFSLYRGLGAFKTILAQLGSRKWAVRNDMKHDENNVCKIMNNIMINDDKHNLINGITLH